MTTASDMPGDNNQLATPGALTVLGTPADWLKTAGTEQGSGWPDMVAWLGERSGARKPVPEQLGGGGLRPLADAPGTYVFDT